MEDTRVEFSVQMSSPKCAEYVREALTGMGTIQTLDPLQGRIVIETREPWSLVQQKIEKTGRRAVLVGFGGQSAVAAITTINSDSHRTPIQGVVRFSAITNDKAGIVVDGTIDNLLPGLHGMHIHETGDISQGCYSVGEHYNPRGSPHGGPQNPATHRHAGDLGNIRADENGRATFRFVDPVLEVWDIIGRSVVITEREDDLGCGGVPQSLIDGNSGHRLACGIIARSAGILQNFKKICACDGVTLWDERDKPLAGGTRAQKL